jgi:P27 family predicted phage terminase small subunit
LSLLDRAQMEAYCNFCARYREAVRILDAWPGDKWTKEYRDMLRVERQLYDAMSRAADAFGMTPQSRSRISAPQTPETDEFTELLGY